EIRTAKVLSVREHPNADRLYLIEIDLGTEKRQVVAGIRKSYIPEELIGKNVAVIANLKPAVIRGEESNGMILAASNEESTVILTTEKDIPAGSTIK
ncbi:MAG: methionine--tRNA ligase, partial [Candidatus Omnitrophica bacterium]|nr:methionine--tRNA ligase [Candidatus Omnitrophota bacterium]